jgi:site-specific DNA-methyltransferase (adenine-specific)
MGFIRRRGMKVNSIYNENCLDTISKMADNFIDLTITSPPYWNLRDYGNDEQLGLEETYQEYLNKLINIFQQLRLKIKDTGSLWVNLGDTYSTISGTMGNNNYKQPKYEAADSAMNFKQAKTGFQKKTLLGIPDRFKIMMIDSGWICRNDIIWHKPNAMPSPVHDRFTVDYERMFFFTKKTKYYFKTQRVPHKESSIKRVQYPWRGNLCAGHSLSGIKDGDMSKMCHPDGRNMRTVWSINTQSNKFAHFASYPEQLIDIPVKACCPKNGIVYDPFMGSGTTALVAIKNGCKYLGSEISKEYCEIINKRIDDETRQGNLFSSI